MHIFKTASAFAGRYRLILRFDQRLQADPTFYDSFRQCQELLWLFLSSSDIGELVVLILHILIYEI